MVAPIRPLDRQFGRRTVNRVRKIQAQLRSIGEFNPETVVRYYSVQVERALESGLLLASLLVATSLLELIVRLRLVKHRQASERADRPHRSARKILKQAEEDRSLSFSRMIKELNEAKMLTAGDMAALDGLYTSVRIPLHHAIAGRLIRKHRDDFDLFELIDLPYGSREFENVIEERALIELEKLCKAIRTVMGARRKVPRSDDLGGSQRHTNHGPK